MSVFVTIIGNDAKRNYPGSAPSRPLTQADLPSSASIVAGCPTCTHGLQYVYNGAWQIFSVSNPPKLSEAYVITFDTQEDAQNWLADARQQAWLADPAKAIYVVPSY